MFVPNKFLMKTVESVFNHLDDNKKALYSDFETKFRTYLVTEYDIEVIVLVVVVFQFKYTWFAWYVHAYPNLKRTNTVLTQP